MADDFNLAKEGFQRTKLAELMLVAGPLVGLAAGLFSHLGWGIDPAAPENGGLKPTACITLGIALWTALWWMFEAVPVPVGALVPLAMLPMMGVITAKQVAGAFGHELILLMLGGFMLSTALEKCGAHRRLALLMVNFCGGKGGKRLVLGFMVATAFLSMWISNTATTLMMLPIAMAVLQDVKDRSVTVPLLLGIAFAANVGGIGTPIGTPPNLVFMSQYNSRSEVEMTFADWMVIGVPISVVMVVVIWLWLSRGLRDRSPVTLPKSGAWRPAEIRTLAVFVVVAALWITRKYPGNGWSGWLGLPGANDASVAFLGVIALFCIPDGEKKGEKLLDWKTANRIPWGLLVLMGSGIALAAGFRDSGLSEAIAGSLQWFENFPPILVIFSVALLITFLTELTSNTATTTLMMPIMALAAEAADMDIALLMVPAAISASCAFMLPVATLPNAIVFGTGKVSIPRMVREGFVLNLLGACVVTTLCYLIL